MRTVWDALALIPGVMINQGGQGGLLVAVRGFSAPFNSGNIKVLLNSVPMSRDNSGLSSQALSLPIEQVAKRWIVASRPEDVVDAVRFYTDLGFEHLVLHGPGHDQERFLRTLGEQVLPGLRELHPN